jgi:hypothetical protein
MADILVHRLFAVGLDLHAALTYLEAKVSEHTATHKIHNAIEGLDDAIRDVRAAVFGIRHDGASLATSGSLRAMIVEAVERSCGPGGGTCPAITLGCGLDAVIDEAGAQQVARVVHRILALVPADRLPATRVEVTADPRPPGGLVVHIDAPAHGLADVAARLGTLAGRRIEVTHENLTAPRDASRVRVECRTPP